MVVEIPHSYVRNDSESNELYNWTELTYRGETFMPVQYQPNQPIHF